ncbi:MAG TPA: aromatic aminobenezylarsenical efflux permease ArsG family transporter [Candidatus Deferrimicrobiaceae bacterium]
MDGYALGAGTALWLGVLTAISPCPLTTNIAAVSFIGRQYSHPLRVTLAGLAYVAGRVATYVALGVLLAGGLLSAPSLSTFLQRWMNAILGPILILVGMLLLGLLAFEAGSGSARGARLKEWAAQGGVPGAFLLGALFALSFCPISGALFLGSLVPLAVTHNAPVLFPLLYGVGTGAPAALFALLIAMGAKSVGSLFDKVGRAEGVARKVTGAVFIAAGVFFTLRYTFELF